MANKSTLSMPKGKQSKVTAKAVDTSVDEIEIPANMISGIEFYNSVNLKGGKTVTFKNGAETCNSEAAKDLISAMFEAIKQKRAENDKARVRFVDSEYSYWVSKKEGSKFWNVWRKPLA